MTALFFSLVWAVASAKAPPAKSVPRPGILSGVLAHPRTPLAPRGKGVKRKAPPAKPAARSAPARKLASALRPPTKSHAPSPWPLTVARPQPTSVARLPSEAPPSRKVSEEEALPPDASDPDGERITRMQEALYSIVHGPILGRLRVGIRVLGATSGRTFYERRASVLMDPASNQKVLATSTALMRLGGTWRYRTELLGPAPDADGVIPGNVVLRGTGDPSLLAAHLEEMAGALVSRGVVRIDGAILADARRIGSEETVAKERSPLRVNRAAITIRVRPGPKAGAAPTITVRPVSDAFTITNRATTRPGGRSRVSVSLSSAGGRMVVTVGGRISIRHPGVVMRRVPPSPLLYSAALLRGALVEQGIGVGEGAGLLASHPAGRAGGVTSILLAEHESEPLGLMIRRINKDSDNEYADRLLETVGAELYGGAATPAKGVRALREAITELGLPPGDYVPVNGSGLGHANRITADAMATLLQRIFQDPRFGPEIVQSLSVGGVDGTTRNRFRGSPAAERVRAKTGTLRGKSCLSGYVGDGAEILVFSILCEGLRGRRLAAVRDAQVSAVNAMMLYVRGAEGTAGEDVAAAADLEAGDENLESEETESTGNEQGPAPGKPGESVDALIDKALRKMDLPPSPPAPK